MPFEPTPEQQEILGHDPQQHGVILAGPGTGKSATVVALIDRLARRDQPPKVKLLTFTRAATSELAKKVSEHPQAAAERPSTIHSFAIGVLLRNPGSANFPIPLRLADDWEHESIVRPTLGKRMAGRPGHGCGRGAVTPRAKHGRCTRRAGPWLWQRASLADGQARSTQLHPAGVRLGLTAPNRRG